MILSSPRVALVTGGTEGLGLELVRKLAARGDRVFVVARHEHDVAGVAPSARFIAADAGDPSFAEIVAAALDRAGVDRLDLLIHNAADGWYGAPADMPPGRAESLLAVNTWASLALTHRLASRVLGQQGQRQPHGHVVFIGSIAAHVPAPRYAVYAASKAGLDGLARSLAAEWAGRATVQAIHPGPIATSFHARAGLRDVDTSRMPSAARVATQVLARIEGRRWRAFTSRPIAAIALASRWFVGVIDLIAISRERATRVKDG